MDFAYLYTRFDGRLNRKPFWMGSLIILVAGVIASVVLGVLAQGRPGIAGVLAFLVYLIMLYPLVALGVKRLHDRGKPGYFMAIFIVPGLLSQLAQLLGLNVRMQDLGGPLVPVPTALGTVLALAAFVVGIWALVELGLRKGAAGDNAYGPDPLAADRAAA